MPAATARLPSRLVLFHGFGAVAYGVKDSGFSTFLLLFYNQVLGMDPAKVSLALALALFLDAFLDPLIGHLGDRTRSRWGRRLPWLYAAPIPLALAWTLLWSPSPGNAPGFVELVLVAMLVRTLVSACEVPSIALVPELTRDYDERSRLVRWRFLMSWGGGLVMLFLAYQVFLRDGMLSAEGYHRFGIAGAVLIAVSVLVSAAGQHRTAAAVRYPDAATPLSPLGVFREIREAFTHPAFVVVVSAEIFAYTSQGITFSIANYLYLFVWRFSQSAYQLYPLLLFASVVAAFVAVGPLHRSRGKKQTAVRATLAAMVFWAIPFLCRAAGAWPVEGRAGSTALVFTFFFVANSLSVSATISIVSMIADVVEAAEVETGRRSEGTFYSGHLFAQKCATGLGIFVTGLLLGWAGLPGQARPGEVAGGVIDRMALGYISLVIVLSLVIAAILRRFPIDRKDHEERLAALSSAARLDPDAGGLHP